jgi:hypothetical protein
MCRPGWCIWTCSRSTRSLPFDHDAELEPLRGVMLTTSDDQDEGLRYHERNSYR